MLILVIVFGVFSGFGEGLADQQRLDLPEPRRPNECARTFNAPAIVREYRPGEFHKPLSSSGAYAVARGVRRLASAEKQFEHAKLQKRRIRVARGEGRVEARKHAVQAYRAVREYFPRDVEWVPEASFRAGELLRSGGSIESAISEFQHAERTGGRSVFRARAGLELGHIHRRVGRSNEALKCYERVEALGPEFAEQRDLGAYWQGKVHSTLGRNAAARRCFQRAADTGVEPLQRIRAFDAWAEVLIGEEELEGAAGVLERCRVALKDQAEELSTLGKRVRGALDHMRSPARLAIAVAERRRRRSG